MSPHTHSLAIIFTYNNGRDYQDLMLRRMEGIKDSKNESQERRKSPSKTEI
jgi:hypothetical protein